ncbi:MAG: transmembrane 220 family protein [Lewinella sp.]|nr:transmembrane 220 family protein [Lewinella sp.]
MRGRGIIRLVIAAVFLLFAAVQFNDPDPWRWVAMYGGTGLLVGASAFWLVPRWLGWIGLAVVVFWMAWLLPEFIHWIRMGMPTITGGMKAGAPHIEYTREFLGLLLCGLALGWISRKKSRG